MNLFEMKLQHTDRSIAKIEQINPDKAALNKQDYQKNSAWKRSALAGPTPNTVIGDVPINIGMYFVIRRF